LFADAVDQINRVLSFDTDVKRVVPCRSVNCAAGREKVTLGYAYAAAERPSEVSCILFELDKIARRVQVSKYDVAQIFIKLGDFDKAFELLEAAFIKRDISLVLLDIDPDLEEIRHSKRFNSLMLRVNSISNISSTA